MFFDACDGFFTNYNWTEQSLEWMSDYSGARGRQADIYIGVDVFARGQVVGGMFETNKVHRLGSRGIIHVSAKRQWLSDHRHLVCAPSLGLLRLQALEIIRKHKFSAAIFAPGWVYEAHDDKSEFRKNQDKWGQHGLYADAKPRN